jgi:hypothetical protein
MVLTLPLCVLCGPQNKQLLFPHTALTDWFLYPKWRVFTARYALNTYIKQIRFVFKGLNIFTAKDVNIYVEAFDDEGCNSRNIVLYI